MQIKISQEFTSCSVVSRCEKAQTTDTDFCWRIYVINSKSIPSNLLPIKTCSNICLQARTDSAFCSAVFLSQKPLISLFSHFKQAVGNECWPNCARWLNDVKVCCFFAARKNRTRKITMLSDSALAKERKEQASAIMDEIHRNGIALNPTYCICNVLQPSLIHFFNHRV